MTLLLLLVAVAAAIAAVIGAHRLDQHRLQRSDIPWPLVGAAVLSAVVALGAGGTAAGVLLEEQRQGGQEVALDTGPTPAADGTGATAGSEEDEADDAHRTDGAASTADLDVVESPRGSDIRVAVALSREQRSANMNGHVVLVRPGPSVDALVARGLAGLLGGAVLMAADGALPAETAAEIDRLGTPEVHIIGGSQAVLPEVEAALVDAGHGVHRHGGATGVDTAIDIATRHFPTAQRAILAPTFPRDDTSLRSVALLAAGGLAGSEGLPVLLSGRSELSPATAAHLEASAIETLIVLGDDDEWDDDVLDALDDLDLSVTRPGGEDAAEAVATIAASMAASSSEPVLLVGGSGSDLWPGLLVAATTSARRGAPIVLAGEDGLPAATEELLGSLSGESRQLRCMSGVDDDVCAQARALLRPEDG